MIRTIQKFKRSIFGLVLVGMIAMTMLGFGMNLSSKDNNKQDYAIKVDNETISFDKLNRARKELEARYRQMFGKQFDMFKSQMNISQQTVDNLIAETLLNKFADKLGFVSSTEEVKQFLMTNLFSKGFDQETYNNFLNQMRMTAGEFESDIANDLKRQQVVSLLSDFSKPSSLEIKSDIKRDLTKVSANILSIDTKKVLETTAPRAEEDLKNYYDENTTDFELPAKVDYDYILVDEKNFPGLVEVSDDEIGLYYTDNQDKFKTSGERKLAQIQVWYPLNAKDEDKAAVKKTAEEVMTKIKEGKENFETLAKKYSNDASSKDKGGDLGYIAKGKMTKEFDAKVFTLPKSDEAVLVETPNGFHIVKVLDIKEPVIKPLEEVKQQITDILKRENAAVFTSSKSSDFYENWGKGNQTLSEFAASKSSKVSDSKGLINITVDPELQLKGLSKEVYERKDESKQLIELGDNFILVELKDAKDPTIPPFESVKATILEKLRNEDAKANAKKLANEILADLKSKKIGDIKHAAADKKLEIKEVNDLSKSAQSKDLPDPRLLPAITSLSAVGALTDSVVEGSDKFYIAEVSKVTLPEAKDIAAKTLEYTKREASQGASQTLITSILNTLKAKAEKDINARALSEG